MFKRLVTLLTLAIATLYGEATCKYPSFIEAMGTGKSLGELSGHMDVRRNYASLNKLCTKEISFVENGIEWKMLLVTHPSHPKGAFWFLPHDDENSAFDAALYATLKYGGGFLAVEANDQRFHMGQDPNRNFGDTPNNCKLQKAPAPKYSKTIFGIINTYKPSFMPYLALHNNKDGWTGNGGSGGISILNSTPSSQSYPAFDGIDAQTRGLKDEDSMVYIAGTASAPDKRKLSRLISLELNTKYEAVNRANNDCSLSNYIVLTKGSTNYYNIETEHGDTATQKAMIDRLMKIIR